MKRSEQNIEQDDKPLDRLVGKGAPKRQVRLYREPTNGKLGLLMAIRPQSPVVHENGILVVGHEERLPVPLEIAPGMRFMPRIEVRVFIELTPEQMAEYERYVISMKTPSIPLTP